MRKIYKGNILPAKISQSTVDGNCLHVKRIQVALLKKGGEYKTVCQKGYCKCKEIIPVAQNTSVLDAAICQRSHPRARSHTVFMEPIPTSECDGDTSVCEANSDTDSNTSDDGTDTYK